MVNRREQLWVGLFVMIAAAVLVAVVLSASGAFGSKGARHRAYFKFAAGLAPAAPARYGGLLAGKVASVRVDPQDSTRIEVDFILRPDIPVKTDSVAKITSLGALGESYLEITTGSRDSALAPPGSVLRSRESLAIGDVGDMLATLAPMAQQVLQTMNERLVETKVTIAGINDVLNERNRQNIADSVATLNTMLTETRPKIAATLANVQTASDRLPALSKNMLAASEKLSPLVDDLKVTVKQGNETLAHIDAILTETRPEIRGSMADVRRTLDTANKTLELLQSTLYRNGDNLDESLLNVRMATDNLKEMTDTLKRNPSVLLRGEIGKDRVPGGTR